MKNEKQFKVTMINDSLIKVVLARSLTGPVTDWVDSHRTKPLTAGDLNGAVALNSPLYPVFKSIWTAAGSNRKEAKVVFCQANK